MSMSESDVRVVLMVWSAGVITTYARMCQFLRARLVFSQAARPTDMKSGHYFSVLHHLTMRFIAVTLLFAILALTNAAPSLQEVS